jgi:prevent-host-death family protein
MIDIKLGGRTMINIRPVSDLRNKYPEIEDLVLKEDEAVYLTKNGYGSMVVLSLEKYEKLMSEAEYSEYIESSLDEAEEQMKDKKIKKLSHDEVFKKMRRKLDEQ